MITSSPSFGCRKRLGRGIIVIAIVELISFLRGTSSSPDRKSQGPCSLALKAIQSFAFRELSGLVSFIMVTPRSGHFGRQNAGLYMRRLRILTCFPVFFQQFLFQRRSIFDCVMLVSTTSTSLPSCQVLQ